MRCSSAGASASAADSDRPLAAALSVPSRGTFAIAAPAASPARGGDDPLHQQVVRVRRRQRGEGIGHRRVLGRVRGAAGTEPGSEELVRRQRQGLRAYAGAAAHVAEQCAHVRLPGRPARRNLRVLLRRPLRAIRPAASAAGRGAGAGARSRRSGPARRASPAARLGKRVVECRRIDQRVGRVRLQPVELALQVRPHRPAWRWRRRASSGRFRARRSRCALPASKAPASTHQPWRCQACSTLPSGAQTLSRASVAGAEPESARCRAPSRHAPRPRRPRAKAPKPASGGATSAARHSATSSPEWSPARGRRGHARERLVERGPVVLRVRQRDGVLQRAGVVRLQPDQGGDFRLGPVRRAVLAGGIAAGIGGDPLHDGVAARQLRGVRRHRPGASGAGPPARPRRRRSRRAASTCRRGEASLRSASNSSSCARSVRAERESASRSMTMTGCSVLAKAGAAASDNENASTMPAPAVLLRTTRLLAAMRPGPARRRAGGFHAARGDWETSQANPSTRSCPGLSSVRRLGRQPYEPVGRAMQAFTDTRGPDTPDELWVLEHDPVFTLGQAGTGSMRCCRPRSWWCRPIAAAR